MGIASFFPWFQKTFSKYVTYIRPTESYNNIDNVLVDMNGIFHPIAQKVFRYGKYSKSLLSNDTYNPTFQQFYDEVGKEIDKIITLIPPVKRLILCVDGVAPVAKQIQQRQRRYKSKLESGFDPNSLTPGTELMYNLCNYIEQFIKKYNFEVIFSSSSVPGEGEIKLINFIKYYSGNNDTSAIYGLDADIILLSLCALSNNKKIFVIRERDTDYTIVNVSLVHDNLIEKLRWNGNFSSKNLIIDFVFMCFLVGNDFLKRAPGIDIITGSIDLLIDIYKQTCVISGHLTTNNTFNSKSLKLLFSKLGEIESYLFEIKIQNINKYIEDPLFNKYIVNNKTLDVIGYKKEYYATKFNDPVSKVVEEYLEGLEWVLGYYTNGLPSWKWYYPYNYSPFMSDISNVEYKHKVYGRTIPYDQLYQLLLVLPPHSMNLLPAPLNTIYLDFPELFPLEVKIDKGGKRHEYEGEVLIPAINSIELFNSYTEKLPSVKSINLNIKNKSMSIYKNSMEYIDL